jgi:Helix-turn-helix domain
MRDVRALAEPEQVSKFLGVPVTTLAQWRYRGIGPRYAKVGRHIRYRWPDVEEWVDEQASSARGKDL